MGGPLDLGAFLAIRGDGRPDPEVLGRAVAVAERCEALGYGSVWINEHHFIGYGRCPSPLAMAGYVLGRTTRLRVGTAVVLLGLHHPLAVAEQALLVSQLSGGRLDLGPGKGAYARDQAAFGLGADGVGPTLDERWTNNLDTLLTAIDGLAAYDDGRGLADGYPLVPDPAAGRPPLLVATATASTIAWAAQHGIGLLLPYHLGVAGQRALLDSYRRAAEDADIDPAAVEHVATAFAYVADTDEQARREALDAAIPWLESGADPMGEELLRDRGWGGHIDAQRSRHADRGPAAMAAWIVDCGVVGSPERCRAWFDELLDAGVRRYALFADVAATDARADENLASLADITASLQGARPEAALR